MSDPERYKKTGGIAIYLFGCLWDGFNRKKYDLEIQREDRGANPHRARYHASVLDVENLDAGQEFAELPDTYTIFITEKDFYEQGKPVYVVERINLTTGKKFEDGEHILYVNGEYRGESELGKLMHDFNCTEADDMNFSLIAERTRYLKENPEGVSEMCKVMEDMRNETVLAERRTIARSFILMGGLSYEQIAEGTKLSIEEVKELAGKES